jgi:hypothetical protein
MNQLNQAKKYHEWHINVIPIRKPGDKYESKGKERTSVGKEPAIRFVKDYKYGEREQTDFEIKDLFETRFPDCNIGAVAGFGSGNLLGLDHDNVEKLNVLRAQSPTYRNIIDKTLSTRTRRGRHYFVRTNVPAKNGKNGDFDIDFKGQNGIIVMPESIWKHDKKEGKYLFEREWDEILQVSIADLSFLGVRPAPDLEYGGGTYGIGKRLFSVFDGNTLRYPSRSDAEQAVLLKFVANGYPLDAIQAIFKKHSSADTHYAQHDNPTDYLVHSHGEAVEYHKNNLRDFDIQIQEAMQIATNMQFATPATREVMIHILQVAREAGRLDLNLSVRMLAERSNKCFKTISNSLLRLTDSQHIEKIGDEHYGQAATYRVNLPAKCSSIHTSSQGSFPLMCVPMNSSPEFTLGLDVFTHLGLGSTGYRIVTFLNQNIGKQLTLQEIMNGTGISRCTIRRKLEALDAPIEISQLGRKFIYTLKRAFDDSDLKKISRKKGVEGRKETLKKRHESERKNYQHFLDNRNFPEETENEEPRKDVGEVDRKSFTERLDRLKKIGEKRSRPGAEGK